MMPEYGGLRWAAAAFWWLAAISFGLAAIVLVFGVVLAFFPKYRVVDPFGVNLRTVSEIDPVPGIVAAFSGAFTLAGSGFLCWFWSNVISAFRDIARNTWFTAFGPKTAIVADS